MLAVFFLGVTDSAATGDVSVSSGSIATFAPLVIAFVAGHRAIDSLGFSEITLISLTTLGSTPLTALVAFMFCLTVFFPLEAVGSLAISVVQRTT
jgi:hypothetical protein